MCEGASDDNNVIDEDETTFDDEQIHTQEKYLTWMTLSLVPKKCGLRAD